MSRQMIDQLRAYDRHNHRGKYAKLMHAAADQMELLVLCVETADRLHGDTMYKWAPEAKDFYISARARLQLGKEPSR